MRHVDGHEVVVNDTIKPGSGMRKLIMHLKWKWRYKNSGTTEVARKSMWELKEQSKQQSILGRKALNMSSLQKWTITVIITKSPRGQK